MNGLILADGANSSGGGAGSGGSVWIIANKLQGHGLLSAAGGDADVSAGGRGGGGGGGRIAMHITDISDFGGKITAFGGTGTEAGAAGSIYTHYTDVTLTERRDVLIDNNGIAAPGRTVLIEPENIRLDLRRNGILELASSNATRFDLPHLKGDYSGTIHVKSGQQGPGS